MTEVTEPTEGYVFNEGPVGCGCNRCCGKVVQNGDGAEIDGFPANMPAAVEVRKGRKGEWYDEGGNGVEVHGRFEPGSGGNAADGNKKGLGPMLGFDNRFDDVRPDGMVNIVPG